MASTVVSVNPGSLDLTLKGPQLIVIDAYTDLVPGDEKTQAAPIGSQAVIIESGTVYMKKNDGTWAEFGGGT